MANGRPERTRRGSHSTTQGVCCIGRSTPGHPVCLSSLYGAYRLLGRLERPRFCHLPATSFPSFVDACVIPFASCPPLLPQLFHLDPTQPGYAPEYSSPGYWSISTDLSTVLPFSLTAWRHLYAGFRSVSSRSQMDSKAQRSGMRGTSHRR